jgi:hypothetical protein
VLGVVENIIPTYLGDPFLIYNNDVNFISYPLSINETEVILDCASYYKKTINMNDFNNIQNSLNFIELN